MRADVARVVAAQREEAAVGVERELGARGQVARLVVGSGRPRVRSQVHFTGRRRRRAAQATSANSG